MAAEPDLHRPTLRVLDALEAISQHPEGCTLTDVADAIGASKSTLVPVLRTMERRGFISMDPESSRYLIGIRSFAVGSAFSEGESLVALIRAEMESLVGACSETCQLGVLDGGNVFYVAKVDSPEPIRMISSIGMRVPAYCSAIGKALLSDCTAERLHELYPDALRHLTPKTVATVDDLAAMISSQRKEGLFTEHEESTRGLACFAVPLRREGSIVAAVSVSVPLFRLDDAKATAVERELRVFRPRAERLIEAYPGDDGILSLQQ